MSSLSKFLAALTIRVHCARRRVRHRRTLGSAWRGTEQSAIGLDDGNPPPGIATKTFAYSAANRMASVSENGELLMRYRYNGAGERVYRSGSGQTAHTVFDPSGQWLGDYDEQGQSIQQAIWLGDLPVGLLALLDGGERRVFYIQPDALGTPRVVIDPTRGAQGTAVWRWELEDEAFGETDPDQDPDGDNTWFVLDMRYPGQQHDSATGFNYNYFRDYDASIGRYVQSDPIGLKGDIATYAYASSKPTIYVDPDGQEPIPVGCDGGNGITLCDGNGGFEVRVCNQKCTSQCTREHEEQHREDFIRRLPNRCQGKRKGDTPTLRSDSTKPPYHWYQFECRAIRAGIKCAERTQDTSVMCVDEQCRRDVASYISYQKELLRNYKCNIWGW